MYKTNVFTTIQGVKHIYIYIYDNFSWKTHAKYSYFLIRSALYRCTFRDLM